MDSAFDECNLLNAPEGSRTLLLIENYHVNVRLRELCTLLEEFASDELRTRRVVSSAKLSNDPSQLLEHSPRKRITHETPDSGDLCFTINGFDMDNIYDGMSVWQLVSRVTQVVERVYETIESRERSLFLHTDAATGPAPPRVIPRWVTLPLSASAASAWRLRPLPDATVRVADAVAALTAACAAMRAAATLQATWAALGPRLAATATRVRAIPPSTDADDVTAHVLGPTDASCLQRWSAASVAVAAAVETAAAPPASLAAAACVPRSLLAEAAVAVDSAAQCFDVAYEAAALVHALVELNTRVVVIVSDGWEGGGDGGDSAAGGADARGRHWTPLVFPASAVATAIPSPTTPPSLSPQSSSLPYAILSCDGLRALTAVSAAPSFSGYHPQHIEGCAALCAIATTATAAAAAVGASTSASGCTCGASASGTTLLALGQTLMRLLDARSDVCTFVRRRAAAATWDGVALAARAAAALEAAVHACGAWDKATSTVEGKGAGARRVTHAAATAAVTPDGRVRDFVEFLSEWGAALGGRGKGR